MDRDLDMVVLGLRLEEAITDSAERVREGMRAWAAARPGGWGAVYLGCLVWACRGRQLLAAMPESDWVGAVADELGPEGRRLFSAVLDVEGPWEDSFGEALLTRSPAAVPTVEALRSDAAEGPTWEEVVPAVEVAVAVMRRLAERMGGTGEAFGAAYALPCRGRAR